MYYEASLIVFLIPHRRENQTFGKLTYGFKFFCDKYISVIVRLIYYIWKKTERLGN
jgi:hypothetical protein